MISGGTAGLYARGSNTIVGSGISKSLREHLKWRITLTGETMVFSTASAFCMSLPPLGFRPLFLFVSGSSDGIDTTSFSSFFFLPLFLDSDMYMDSCC